MNRKALLSVRDLSVEHAIDTPQPVRAVDGLSLDLYPGECLGIVGESGCGKTSLGLALMKLLPEARIEGTVRFDNYSITAMRESAFRPFRWQRLAMVFQNGNEVLNPVLTLRSQIGEVLRTHLALPRRQIRQRTAELFDLVNLDRKWLEQYPHQLSGGMRQRMLLALALACKPDLLIVDEPTSSLDDQTRTRIINLICELQSQYGFAMICISHDVGAVRQLADRVMTLYAGQPVELGPVTEVIRDPQHPYTRGLLNAAPELLKYRDLWGLHGEPPAPGGLAGCPFHPRCSQATRACRTTRPPLMKIAGDRQVACHKGGIETLLSAKSLSKTYQLRQQEIRAVSEASLAIKSGEVVALVGGSGSGKSTLAHMLAGILECDSGSVAFQGKRIDGNSASRIKGGVQIVFQDPFAATSPRLSVIEAVREPLDIMEKGDPARHAEQAREMLKRTRLPTDASFLARPCGTLSGGQRQRVAIARALITEPRVLIADEITAMLDPSTQAHILRELKSLQNSSGFAMLYITHQIPLARKIADRVYVKHQGRIIRHGFATEVFDLPAYSLNP